MTDTIHGLFADAPTTMGHVTYIPLDDATREQLRADRRTMVRLANELLGGRPGLPPTDLPASTPTTTAPERGTR